MTNIVRLRDVVARLKAALDAAESESTFWRRESSDLMWEILAAAGFDDVLVFPLRSNDDPEVTCFFCGEAKCDVAITYQRTMPTVHCLIGCRVLSGAHSACVALSRVTTSWSSKERAEDTVAMLKRGLEAAGEQTQALAKLLEESQAARAALMKERDALLATVTANAGDAR